MSKYNDNNDKDDNDDDKYDNNDNDDNNDDGDEDEEESSTFGNIVTIILLLCLIIGIGVAIWYFTKKPTPPVIDSKQDLARIPSQTSVKKPTPVKKPTNGDDLDKALADLNAKDTTNIDDIVSKLVSTVPKKLKEVKLLCPVDQKLPCKSGYYVAKLDKQDGTPLEDGTLAKDGTFEECCLIDPNRFDPTKIEMAIEMSKQVMIGLAPDFAKFALKKAEKLMAKEAIQTVKNKLAVKLAKTAKALEIATKNLAKKASDAIFKKIGQKIGQKLLKKVGLKATSKVEMVVAKKIIATVAKKIETNVAKGAVKMVTKLGYKATASLGAKAGVVGVKLGVKIGARLGIMGTKMLAKLGMGPIGIATMVFDVLSLALDIWDPAGFNNIVYLGDIKKLKKSGNESWDNMIREGGDTPPIIIGPLTNPAPGETEAHDAYMSIFTDAYCTSYIEPLIEHLDYANLSDKEVEEIYEKLYNKAYEYFETTDGKLYLTTILCKRMNGKMIDYTKCSFRNKSACNKSYTWPIKEDSAQLYAEWRNNRCEGVNPAVRAMCDSMKRGVTYNEKKQLCKITKDYCYKMGVDFHKEDGEFNCYINPFQQAAAFVLGDTITKAAKVGINETAEAIGIDPALVGTALMVAATGGVGASWGTAAYIGQTQSLNLP